MLQDMYPAAQPKQHSIWHNEQPPEPCAVVIFGATGDLTQRKLLPTLAHLFKDHPLQQPFSVVAAARRPINHDQWREMALRSINTYMPEHDKLDDAAQRAFAACLFYCQTDFADREGYTRLADLLDQLDREQGTQGNRIFYLATPPDTDTEIIYHLGGCGLARPSHKNEDGDNSWTRLIIEKPLDMIWPRPKSSIVSSVESSARTRFTVSIITWVKRRSRIFSRSASAMGFSSHSGTRNISIMCRF